MKIAIISDTHLHNWTQFAHVTNDGINSRLKVILRQMEWVAQVAKNTFGCSALIHCGDLFHVKNGIPTSVLIPTRATIDKMRSFFPYIEDNRLDNNMIFLAGNHDLEFADGRQSGASTNLFAPMTTHDAKTFASFSNVFTFLPWQQNVDVWKETFLKICKSRSDGFSQCHYVFTHAPLDGAVAGVPEFGINQAWLDQIGFKGKIFAGHYHNHKAVSPQLISVGALCHHTWNDVGSKAGFIVLDTKENDWQFFESKTPQFVDLDLTPEAKITGNYVRITADGSIEEANKIKDQLFEAGALGAVVNLKAKEIEANREISVGEIQSSPLNVTLKNYIDKRLTGKEQSFVDEVQKTALDILTGQTL